MVQGNGGVGGAMCWLAGAVRALQKEVRELKWPYMWTRAEVFWTLLDNTRNTRFFFQHVS